MSVTKTSAAAKIAEDATSAQDAADKTANIAPATDFEASGAVIEDGAKDGVDMTHPAVDANPRAGTTIGQNQIDFNDPVKTGAELAEDDA